MIRNEEMIGGKVQKHVNLEEKKNWQKILEPEIWIRYLRVKGQLHQEEAKSFLSQLQKNLLTKKSSVNSVQFTKYHGYSETIHWSDWPIPVDCENQITM